MLKVSCTALQTYIFLTKPAKRKPEKSIFIHSFRASMIEIKLFYTFWNLLLTFSKLILNATIFCDSCSIERNTISAFFDADVSRKCRISSRLIFDMFRMILLPSL